MREAIAQPVLDQGSREASERKGANEGPRDCSRKGHMVVVFLEVGTDVLEWNAIFKDVVNSLDVKGLLDFCVRGDGEMKQEKDGEGEQTVVPLCHVVCNELRERSGVRCEFFLETWSST